MQLGHYAQHLLLCLGKKEKLIDMGDMINYVNNNKINDDIILNVSFGNHCCKSKVPVSAVKYRLCQSLL